MNKKTAYYSILSILGQIRESDFGCAYCPLNEICDDYIELKDINICKRLEEDLKNE